MGKLSIIKVGFLIIILITFCQLTLAWGAASEGTEMLSKALSIWSVIPFVGILLSIALFPLFAPKFWHAHFPKITIFWALALAVPFLIKYKEIALHEILHIYIIDYIPFIILLWALFTITGGILIQGKIVGSPAINTLIILFGTLLASWMGTTGASVLLIRPILRINQNRKHKIHLVIFFIFLVSNIGGSLTPIGDPPLFLGFLHGVPFFWTFNLFPQMCLVVIVLLFIFYKIDSFYYRKEGLSTSHPIVKKVKITDQTEEIGDIQIIEEVEQQGAETPVYQENLNIRGLYNLIFLIGVIAGVLFSGLVKLPELNILGIHVGAQNLIRDGFLILMGILSFTLTHNDIHKNNEFSWFPIKEVGYLFAGIFMTIIPALLILRAGEQGDLGFLIKAVRDPWHYFWVTGTLSSFLDNAPTYLTFFNTALGRFYPGMAETEAVARLIAENARYLVAISAGAVFMGAMTYIGNAPNFMVKSIAEERGVKMPSFFGYMIWSICILIPIFILVNLIFY